MDMIFASFNYLINLDVHLNELVSYFGRLIYLVLFSTIFCETGLVITSFLPGDSLLFIVGALASQGTLNIEVIIVILIIAAILGDTSNYFIGRYLGPKIFSGDKLIFFNKKYILKTHVFYEKYGGKTVLVARFLPMLRAFAPFAAGMGAMPYRKFIIYNVIGDVLWVLIFTLSGFFFGTIPYVKNNFILVVIAVASFSTLSLLTIYMTKHKFTIKKL